MMSIFVHMVCGCQRSCFNRYPNSGHWTGLLFIELKMTFQNKKMVFYVDSSGLCSMGNELNIGCKELCTNADHYFMGVRTRGGLMAHTPFWGGGGRGIINVHTH